MFQMCCLLNINTKAIVGVRAARAIVGGMGRLRGLGLVRRVRAIVGCEYMLGLTKQLFRDIPDYSEKK